MPDADAAGALRRRPAAEPAAAVFDSPAAPPVARAAGEARRGVRLGVALVLILALLVLAVNVLWGAPELQEGPSREEAEEEEVAAPTCGLPANTSLVSRVAERAGRRCVAPLQAWRCQLATFEAQPLAVRQAGSTSSCREGSTEPWAPELQYAPVDDPKLVVGFVILVNKWWGNALRLLTKLFSYSLRTGQDRLHLLAVVHVDARAKHAFQQLQSHAANISSIEVFNTFNITRGGEAMLLASLHGIERLVKGPQGPPDFTLLLSESHYPMRTGGQFYNTLLLHQHLSFVGTHHWFRRGGSLRPFLNATPSPGEYEEKHRVPMFECGGKVFVDESIPVPGALASEPYVGGVQWVALSRELVSAAFIEDGRDGREKISEAVLSQVRLFAQPDEAFFQTLLAVMSARDDCDPLAHQMLGYSLTWNEPAEFVGPDPDSEVEVTSPPFLDHYNEAPNLAAVLSQPWSTPSLFLRKLDNSATRTLQDRLDFVLQDLFISWKPVESLEPMCVLRDRGPRPLNGTGCRPERHKEPASATQMRYNRLVVRLIVQLEEMVERHPPVPAAASKLYPLPTVLEHKEAAVFVTERWALHSPAHPLAPGLRVLALRVGRAAPLPAQGHHVSESRDLVQASVIWPGAEELGLLAYFEVLPVGLHFEVEWQGPGLKAIRQTATAPKHAWSLWSPFPSPQSIQPGRWRVALHLSASTPSGPRLVAWREFLVTDTPGIQDLEEFFQASDTAPGL